MLKWRLGRESVIETERGVIEVQKEREICVCCGGEGEENKQDGKTQCINAEGMFEKCQISGFRHVPE